jgi:hypothetical protein
MNDRRLEKTKQEELHNLYSSPNTEDGKIRKNKMNRACSNCGRDEKCIQNLVGKHEEKRPLGRPRCR